MTSPTRATFGRSADAALARRARRPLRAPRLHVGRGLRNRQLRPVGRRARQGARRRAARAPRRRRRQCARGARRLDRRAARQAGRI